MDTEMGIGEMIAEQEREKLIKEREKKIGEFVAAMFTGKMNREQAIDALEQVRGKIHEHNENFKSGPDMTEVTTMTKSIEKIKAVIDEENYEIFLDKMIPRDEPGYQLTCHTEPIDLLVDTEKHIKNHPTP